MWRRLYDWIFPDTCVSCRKEVGLFCPACIATFTAVAEQVCPVCRSSSKNGTVCIQCKEQTSLSFLLLGSEYVRGSIVSLFIQTLKYKGMSRAITFFPKVVLDVYKESLQKKEYFFVPVPLHPRRLKERGFNQAEVLAEHLGKYYGISVNKTLLRRGKYTPPQASLSRTARHTNVKGAFECAPHRSVPAGIPIIVDDVATTLSTLESCAGVLRTMGYKEIGALAIARGK